MQRQDAEKARQDQKYKQMRDQRHEQRLIENII